MDDKIFESARMTAAFDDDRGAYGRFPAVNIFDAGLMCQGRQTPSPWLPAPPPPIGRWWFWHRCWGVSVFGLWDFIAGHIRRCQRAAGWGTGRAGASSRGQLMAGNPVVSSYADGMQKFVDPNIVMWAGARRLPRSDRHGRDVRAAIEGLMVLIAAFVAHKTLDLIFRQTGRTDQ